MEAADDGKRRGMDADPQLAPLRRLWGSSAGVAPAKPDTRRVEIGYE